MQCFYMAIYQRFIIFAEKLWQPSLKHIKKSTCKK